MRPWNTADDIPLDEEDQCAFCFSWLSGAYTDRSFRRDLILPRKRSVHSNRDRILLGGDEIRYDEDDFGAEDEVFALNGVDSSSEDEIRGEGQEGEEDPMEVDEVPPASSSAKGSRTKSTKAPKPPTPASDSDQDEDESEEETWGTKKSTYYSANDAHFDSEDEEANELEEKEARRLQMKAREGMGDEDFGLDNLQALAEDGRMEPDVIECVFFCSPASRH
jgi:U3 small nucleolar RNA-associated protein 3